MEEKPRQYYQNLYYDRTSMFHHTPYNLEERLVEAVIQGNKDFAVLMLAEISRHGAKAVLANDQLRSAKNSVICSCAFLARAAIRAGVGADEAFALSDAAIRHLESLSSTKAVLGYEQEALLQFIALVEQKLCHEYPPDIMHAIEYIHKHLADKITLRDVATNLDIHPVYLSKKFHRETGQTITEYINRCKVEESVWFVRNTTYSIADIAAMYSFSNQSYFITVFRKLLGYTPGELRTTPNYFI
jgi:YesN/AraC family two-component response regulator